MPFIPLEVFANNPSTTVTSGGTSAPGGGTTETWTVASSATFPAVELGAQQFHVADTALPSEVITVQNVAGATWTVVRGAEGSTPVAHAAGFTIVQVVTAATLAQLQYPSWQFPVQAYGAQGDGKIGAGGTGTSGTSTFTDSTASFVNATAPAGDVGKVIVINQGTGGSATNPFCGTISAVNSATSVTLSANLGATCASAPYIYGTDDSAAINAAISAAYTWARSTGNYKAQVVFEPQNYMLGGLTQSTTFTWSGNADGPFTYNTHIPLPFSGQYDRKLILDLIGVGDASEPDFWGSVVPSLSGTCLVSAVFATSQPNATFGQQSVIGTPATQAGIGTGGVTGAGYANLLANVSGITVVAPWNSQQYGYDFRWSAQANIINASYLAFAPVNLNAQTCGGPYLSASNIVSNGVSCALAMPLSQNNDNDNIGLFSCEGAAIGLIISEHFTAQRLATIYCDVAISVSFLPSGTFIHGGSILYWSCEACNGGLRSSASAGTNYLLFIGNFDTEIVQTYHISDSGNNLSGTVYWSDITASAPTITGGGRLNVVNCALQPGPWSGAPAAPATTVAQQNTSWRPATIVLSNTTAAITSISTGPGSGTTTVTGLVSTTALPVALQVPAGHWFKCTYASGTLVTNWFLH